VTEHALTHIKAVLEALKEGIGDQPAAAPAGLFISGMLTGLAASTEIIKGGTAEGALETVNTRLAAAIGQAYLDGHLPAQPPVLPTPEQLAEARDEAERHKEDYLKACQTITAMHAAATGRTGEGPVRGVVEDVEDVRLRAERTETERDGAYRERNALVALLAACSDGAVVAPAPDVEEPGWQIAYLYLDGRQASWHFGPRDADLAEPLEHVDAADPRAQWDGHTTEQKYAHIAALTAELMQRCGPACSEKHTESGRCEMARNQ
jgi:hypothetical protein